VPARWERGLWASREGGDGAAAVGLMADHEDRLAAVERRVAHVAWRCPRREPFVDLRRPEAKGARVAFDGMRFRRDIAAAAVDA